MNLMFSCSGIEIKVNGRFISTARRHGDKYLFVDDPESVVEALKRAKARVDLFTFIERIVDAQASPRYPYRVERDNFAAVPIRTFDQWWTKQIDNKTRNMVRKAEKANVELREVRFDDDLVRGIHAIYNESPVRQGKPFPHYGKDLCAVKTEEATHLSCSTFIGAFSGEELIGFIKIVRDEKQTQAGLMNIVSMIRHRDKAPTNALIAEAIRHCATRNIPYLVYSNFAYGNKEEDSLADFKRNNGFERFDVPRYYIPLTHLGKLALSCGLHEGRIADLLPRSLASRLRTARNNWYRRQNSPSPRAS